MTWVQTTPPRPSGSRREEYVVPGTGTFIIDVEASLVKDERERVWDHRYTLYFAGPADPPSAFSVRQIATSFEWDDYDRWRANPLASAALELL